MESLYEKLLKDRDQMRDHMKILNDALKCHKKLEEPEKRDAIVRSNRDIERSLS